MIPALLLLLSVVPQPDGIRRESYEEIEVNAFFDFDGRLVFTQVMFRDDEIQAWRLVKDAEQIPRRDWIVGGYVTTWTDNNVVRQIRCKRVKETWTQYDVELDSRLRFPQELRRGLKH